ncbi:MAG: NAD(P)/FAD-dependent oxidoreductase [Bacteroidales bacterium]|jgi:NADH dehydrogenase|nr:NAD(P)/FAD-dependent oxidoreductase [Bacteroidales bacterium]
MTYQKSLNIPDSELPRLVVIGGGFAGIRLIKEVSDRDFQIVLIDRNNYHSFQPLLYQVATGGLEPDSIAYPLRKYVKRFGKLFFRLADVEKIDPEQKILYTSEGNLSYDYAVVATGARTNFFGNSQLEHYTVGMKSIPEALNLRSLILQNLEKAIVTLDPTKRQALMNFVIVGGGPTGVELSGALAELKKFVFREEYHDLKMSDMQVFLIEGAPKLLGGMSEKASRQTLAMLTGMGVKVMLNCRINDYDGAKVELENANPIPSNNVIWAAGVKAAPVPGLEAAVHQPSGRLLTNAFSQVKGFESCFALGDVALIEDDADYPRGHPQVAPAAIQQAELLAQNFKNLLQGKPLKPFKYRDKGSMATIGRKKAVVDISGLYFSGTFAWFVWLFVHLMSIVGFKNRLATLLQWFNNYLNFNSALRLIIRPYKRNI